ncbi:CPBP family intramembrane glutamic endopeptidase [Ruegeria sp.]|uniref:CPBP family intramembrane glutamic endopeptidase n=1 Tax=Ruegeria sp. TaxID=1879320 RepID=UPI0023194F0E|nr:CPBP family intramembrane glutamic endopeptidase [Ruegeria sp.]MDA7964638.1 CPBP family intramembrane metalloprotease [Ruegeria sp.]
MTVFFASLPVIWPWLILITAQIATLTRNWWLGLGLLGLFGLVALFTGLITVTAVAVMALGLLGAAYLPRLRGGAALAGHLALVAWSLALGAHLLPGVHNLLVLDQVHAGPGSAPFTMYLNLDKPMVFFTVLLAWPAILNGGSTLRVWPLVTGLTLLPALLLLGGLSGAVRPEFGLPPWWLIFALSNLFLTCLTEEVFFRGYLQSVIGARLGAATGLIAASLLFGLAHFGGGPVLIGSATLLGLACGLGYWATGRLWVPVLMHFTFNILHLTLFTYPGPA